jgi:primosomal protein N' (replication factor Y)
VLQGTGGWKKQLFVRYNPDAPEPEKLTQRQQEVLAFIQQQGELPLTDLIEQLSCTAEVVRRIERTGKISIASLKVLRDPYSNVRILPTTALNLNEEQSPCLRQITQAMDSEDHSGTKPFLLFGVTGSGKTEIYLQAIAHALEKGQGAIVLVPEISLTPQTVDALITFC